MLCKDITKSALDLPWQQAALSTRCHVRCSPLTTFRAIVARWGLPILPLACQNPLESGGNLSRVISKGQKITLHLDST